MNLWTQRKQIKKSASSLSESVTKRLQLVNIHSIDALANA